MSGLPGLESFVALHEGDVYGNESTHAQPPSAHPPMPPLASLTAARNRFASSASQRSHASQRVL